MFMKQDTVIQVKDISKKFSRRLRYAMLYGMQDIFRTLLGISTHSDMLRRGEFWAVKDVSFELKRGETLGIIGPNGSGKTTILKMLNGIFMPDKGEIRLKGRVGALIQVGAGFHPMLTGRENVYINGIILGMSKSEIDRKFDAIVEFAGIGDFLDTPVKYYSSGMYVRLGFAIAIHCQPDILLIDEVLAVGDMAFVPKCLQRINELREDGIPIVFVSHNMSTISQICTKTMYINKGVVHFIGDTQRAIRQYEDESLKDKLALSRKDYISPEIRSGTGEVQVRDVQFLDKNGIKKDTFQTNEGMIIHILFTAYKKIENFSCNIEIKNQEGLRCFQSTNIRDGYQFGSVEGDNVVKVVLPRLFLAPSVYHVSIALSSEGAPTLYDRLKDVYHFQVRSEKQIYGIMDMDARWELMR